MENFENLANHGAVLEWLEKQRNINFHGCRPVDVLKELLNVTAKIADGQYGDLEEVESDLYAILS